MLDREYVEQLAKRKTDICEHLIILYEIVKELGAKVVVELGAGQSSYVLTAGVNETDGIFYSVDKLKEAHLRGWSDGIGILENEPRYNFIQGDDLKVVETWDKEIDLLFIDTEHDYTHVKSELELWTPFVRIGGKVAIHDTRHKAGHAVGCRVAVDEFVREKSGCFNSRTIEGCGGLTVLEKIKEWDF